MNGWVLALSLPNWTLELDDSGTIFCAAAVISFMNNFGPRQPSCLLITEQSCWSYISPLTSIILAQTIGFIFLLWPLPYCSVPFRGEFYHHDNHIRLAVNCLAFANPFRILNMLWEDFLGFEPVVFLTASLQLLHCCALSLFQDDDGDSWTLWIQCVTNLEENPELAFANGSYPPDLILYKYVGPYQALGLSSSHLPRCHNHRYLPNIGATPEQNPHRWQFQSWFF